MKLDTGMGRWGLSELAAPARDVVGLMTHLATADSDLDFARAQVERFREATAPYAHLTRHAANSAAALRLPEARFDAARCGIALYGLSPFGTVRGRRRARAALSWTSELALVKLLRPGESTGYGRRFVAERETWIGIVPVGYADGFRRDLTGTEVLVDGRAPPRRRDDLDGRLRGRARPRAAARARRSRSSAPACRSRSTPASPARSPTSSPRGSRPAATRARRVVVDSAVADPRLAPARRAPGRAPAPTRPARTSAAR